MKLSIFLAGIRPSNWLKLYQSIPGTTTTDDYELVIVSPYDLPPELSDKKNVQLIKDSGCPTRCYQLGALHSRGEFIVCTADDGTFTPTMSIDKAFAARPPHAKGIVSFTYFEGDITSEHKPVSMPWHLGEHNIMRALKYAPNHYLLLASFLVRRDYFLEAGGWDCQFEQPGIACIDLAIRLQNDGAEVVLGEKYMDIAQDLRREGPAGHKPIEDAHIFNDLPLLQTMYQTVPNRGRIDFDNWKNAEEVWHRRFG